MKQRCTIYIYNIRVCTSKIAAYFSTRAGRRKTAFSMHLVARSNATDSSQFRTSCAGPIVSQLPVNKLPRQFRKLQVQRMKSHNLNRSCALPLFRSDAHTIRLPGWSSFLLTHVLRRICQKKADLVEAVLEVRRVN